MDNFPVSSYRYLYCVTFFNLYGGKNVEITFPLPREKAEKKCLTMEMYFSINLFPELYFFSFCRYIIAIFSYYSHCNTFFILDFKGNDFLFFSLCHEKKQQKEILLILLNKGLGTIKK